MALRKVLLRRRMSTQPVLDYTESMNDVLDWFADQPCSCATIAHIAHGTGYSRETVRKRMKELMGADCAERRYAPTGEYMLTRDPRDDGTSA